MQSNMRLFLVSLGVFILMFSGCLSSSSNDNTSSGNASQVDSDQSKSGDETDKGTVDDEYAYDPGWYKGDLHAHSLYSDGDTPVPDVIAIAENKGFDFFALTDHRTNDQWGDPGYHSKTVTLLYGVEWTTSTGHANIWSNKPFNWDAIAPTMENGGDAKTAIEITHSLANSDQEMLFSINHPRADFCCPWEHSFEDSREADCMEVWNARYLIPNLNFLALTDTYASYLQQGKKITMVGGSDSHTHQPSDLQTLYNDIGHPTTWVYADSKSGLDILTGIKSGHAFISTSPEGPMVDFRASTSYDPQKPAVVQYDLMMGDSIPGSALGKDVYFMVRVFDTTVPSGIHVIKNGMAVAEWATISFSSDYCWDFIDKPQQGDYYRIEIRQIFPDDPTNPIGDLLNGPMSALTNPIYAW
jgi:hypothetical protein